MIVGNIFVAGAWDGPFPALGIIEATTAIGSGGRAADGEFTFCNATHPFDDLYSVRVDDAAPPDSRAEVPADSL